MFPKAGGKRRFASINKTVASPASKQGPGNTQRVCVWSLSVLDVTTPLVLYIANFFYPEV